MGSVAGRIVTNRIFGPPPSAQQFEELLSRIQKAELAGDEMLRSYLAQAKRALEALQDPSLIAENKRAMHDRCKDNLKHSVEAAQKMMSEQLSLQGLKEAMNAREAAVSMLAAYQPDCISHLDFLSIEDDVLSHHVLLDTWKDVAELSVKGDYDENSKHPCLRSLLEDVCNIYCGEAGMACKRTKQKNKEPRLDPEASLKCLDVLKVCYDLSQQDGVCYDLSLQDGLPACCRGRTEHGFGIPQLEPLSNAGEIKHVMKYASFHGEVEIFRTLFSHI